MHFALCNIKLLFETFTTNSMCVFEHRIFSFRFGSLNKELIKELKYIDLLCYSLHARVLFKLNNFIAEVLTISKSGMLAFFTSSVNCQADR